MSRKGTLPHLVSISVFTAIVVALQAAGFAPFVRIEMAIQDEIMRRGRPAERDPSLVFLAIDSASVDLQAANDLESLLHIHEADAESQRALRLMEHAWPWSREVHALVLDRLMKAGARAVIFDLTFPKASPNDDAFRDALERHRAHTAVAGNFSNDVRPAFTGPIGSLIPSEPSVLDERIGFDNFWPDEETDDAVIRSARFRSFREHGVWQTEDRLSLAARALDRAGLGSLIPPGHELHRMRFAGPPGSFAPRSIYELFAPDYWKQNLGSGAFFRDKIVLIGAHGNWQQDEHLTPMGFMPGPELHLNAMNSLLHPDWVRTLSPVGNAAAVFAFALVPALVRRRVRRPYIRFAILLLGSAAWLGAVIWLYDRASIFLPSFAPLAAFNFNGVSGLFLDIVLERREKKQIRGTLERYVSRNVVKELIDDPDQFSRSLGGEMRPVTILFSDVRNFTKFAANMDSRALVAQLNEYFTAMVDCVFAHGGTLDKFIGDAVMAVWGNARSAGAAGDARNAVACALAMREALVRLNAQWNAAGRPELRIGIGLNSGEVVCGNIGSASRMEFTVIGDPVNMAWRLQDYTKIVGTDIVLGDPVVALLGSEFPTEPLEPCRPSEGVVLPCSRLVTPESCPAPALAHR